MRIGPLGVMRGLVPRIAPNLSQLLRQPHKEPAPRAELRREHADAGAVADFVDAVEYVHDVEAHGERLGRGRRDEVVRHAHIDLGVERQRAGVGEA